MDWLNDRSVDCLRMVCVGSVKTMGKMMDEVRDEIVEVLGKVGYDIGIANNHFYIENLLDDGQTRYYFDKGPAMLAIRGMLTEALEQINAGKVRPETIFRNKLCRATEELVNFFDDTTGLTSVAEVRYYEGYAAVAISEECSVDEEIEVRSLRDLQQIAEVLDGFVSDLCFETSCVCKIAQFCAEMQEDEIRLFEQGLMTQAFAY